MRTRVVIAAVAVAVVVFLGGVTPAPARAAQPRWVRPVDGQVTRPFVAPAFTYGPGHRGADLAAPAGAMIRVAGAGVVTFAGLVAERLHVVVTHASGLRTGYSYLAAIRVELGEHLQVGAIVGVAGGGDPASDHDPEVLHFSLRRGDTYLDPMLLFAPVDLAAVVHLAPLPPGWR